MTLSSLLCLHYGSPQQIKIHILWNLGKIKTACIWFNPIQTVWPPTLLGWGCNLSDRVLAQHAPCPEFDLQCHINRSWRHMCETQNLECRGRKIRNSRSSSTSQLKASVEYIILSQKKAQRNKSSHFFVS